MGAQSAHYREITSESGKSVSAVMRARLDEITVPKVLTALTSAG